MLRDIVVTAECFCSRGGSGVAAVAEAPGTAETILYPCRDDISNIRPGQKFIFGSYPQTEIVAKETDSGVHGKKFGAVKERDYIVDADLYKELTSSTSGWDSNGDITINNVKYHKLNKTEATNTYVGDSSQFEWKNGPSFYRYEPIVWQVLAVGENGKALVISDVALDCKRYHNQKEEITWEKSSIRSWLNNDDTGFYHRAFSQDEKNSIIETQIKNEKNTEYNTDGGADTTDKVFLLSKKEVENTSYFASAANRQSKSSTYAKAMGAKADIISPHGGNCYWWLRSPGGVATSAASVTSAGVVYARDFAILTNNAVRPAMYVNLTEINKTTHTGGTATCKEKARCTMCGAEYGEKNPSNHAGKAEWNTTAATHEQKYTCCGAEVVKNAAHSWSNGSCSVCGYNCIHTGGTATCKEKAKCTICGAEYGEKNPSNHTGKVEWTQTTNTHEKKYDCCNQVVVSSQAHTWQAGKCSECGYVCQHTGGKEKWNTTATTHEQKYDCCNKIVVASEAHTWQNGKCSVCGYECKHTGGTATCTKKAICETCKAEYGNLDPDNHAGAEKWNTTATTHEKKCDGCNKVTVLSALHNWKDGVCSVCGYKCKHAYDGTTCKLCGFVKTIVTPPTGGGGGGGGGGAAPAAQNPKITTAGDGKVTIHADGTTTIVPDKGYVIGSVTVNGKDMGKVSTLTGLKASDKVVVTFEKITDEPTAPEQPSAPDKPEKSAKTKLDKQVQQAVKQMNRNLKIQRTSKKSISLTVSASLSKFKKKGYKIKYTYYIKAPKAKKFKAIKVTTSNQYKYTKLKKGTNKFRVKIAVYDAKGKRIAQQYTYAGTAEIK